LLPHKITGYPQIEEDDVQAPEKPLKHDKYCLNQIVKYIQENPIIQLKI
jgi:hypothetical protein